MRILVLGAGGREHALAWKLLQSEKVTSLCFAPAHPAAVEQLQREYVGKKISSWNMSIAGSENLTKVLHKAQTDKIDFVVVGPDNALADGAVDIFEAGKMPVFGPTQAAAQLESSKIFSKEVMKAAGVPTAEFHAAGSLEEARAILLKIDWQTKQWVIKADGLALGKGVEICPTLDEAQKALVRLQKYSSKFVIEERLFGSEISWLAFCDGTTCSLLPPARDYKTLTEDPLSPNTGGMGSICPVPGVSPVLAERIRHEVFLPMLAEMRRRGTPYKGVLYAGLMIHKEQVWVLEFNTRFGDPEAQAILPLMAGDLLEWCQASAAGTLSDLPEEVGVKKQTSVYVVAAAPGYPGDVIVGDAIVGIEKWLEAHHGFFAGVGLGAQNQWVTKGGRVLGALGLGQDMVEARQKALASLQQITFEGMQIRKDVGVAWN